MPRILFWNTAKCDVLSLLERCAEEYAIDLMIFAEYVSDATSTLKMLNRKASYWEALIGLCPRLSFYAKFSSDFVTVLSESDRYSIRRLLLPGTQPIIIVGAHLPSQLYYTESEIGEECRILAREIARTEDAEGHQRTMLVGDLNLNPFAEGLVSATSLHATMSRTLARKITRTVQKQEYRFFYNPMWSALSDKDSDTAGTFFYSGSTHHSLFWNTFDQVLLRPALTESFKHEHLKIITKVGEVSLVDHEGKPDKTNWSDHLPVLIDITSILEQ